MLQTLAHQPPNYDRAIKNRSRGVAACCENQKRDRSCPPPPQRGAGARSPQTQPTDPPTRLARARARARARAPTKRKGDARPTHLGSSEELLRRRGGVAAAAVPVHPLLMAPDRAPDRPRLAGGVLAETLAASPAHSHWRAGAGEGARARASGEMENSFSLLFESPSAGAGVLRLRWCAPSLLPPPAARALF